MQSEHPMQPMRIGFISTRVSGSDGVSLEIAKWAAVLERMGHTCCYIAGQCDRPADRSMVIPEAHFTHPVIKTIADQCFGRVIRTPDVTQMIHEMIWVIKQKLRTAIERLQVDVIIAENCVTIPMNIPLGVAVVEYVIETGIPCRVIPNVMDFGNPPEPPDEYSQGFREAIGLSAEDVLILQPTRVIPRKGIEHAIELVHQLKDPRCKLVITHASGDEGDAYAKRVRRYAEIMAVDVVLADEYRKKMVEHNYQAARHFFSYQQVQDELLAVLAKPSLAMGG